MGGVITVGGNLMRFWQSPDLKFYRSMAATDGSSKAQLQQKKVIPYFHFQGI